MILEKKNIEKRIKELHLIKEVKIALGYFPRILITNSPSLFFKLVYNLLQVDTKQSQSFFIVYTCFFDLKFYSTQLLLKSNKSNKKGFIYFAQPSLNPINVLQLVFIKKKSVTFWSLNGRLIMLKSICVGKKSAQQLG